MWNSTMSHRFLCLQQQIGHCRISQLRCCSMHTADMYPNVMTTAMANQPKRQFGTIRVTFVPPALPHVQKQHPPLSPGSVQQPRHLTPLPVNDSAGDVTHNMCSAQLQHHFLNSTALARMIRHVIAEIYMSCDCQVSKYVLTCLAVLQTDTARPKCLNTKQPTSNGSILLGSCHACSSNKQPDIYWSY